jgi:hypothetical protein
MRGSAIRIHHTRQIPTNDIGWGPPCALESGADDWKALGLGQREPTSRPRLYKIAHSAKFFCKAGHSQIQSAQALDTEQPKRIHGLSAADHS